MAAPPGHLRKEALQLYRDIVRAARNFQWPNEQGRPWRDVLVESARSEFEAARHVTDSAEVMQRLLVGRHCLEEAARKFEEKRRSLVGEQGGAPPPSDEPRR